MRRAILWILMLSGIAALGYGGYQMITKRMKGPRWENLLPEMKQKTLDLLPKAEKEGLKVMFFDGWRSVEDSQENIEKGSSHLTDPYNTEHLWGGAVDIVFVDDLGLPSWPPLIDPRWAKLISIAKSVGLEHPLDWDGPHFRLPGFSVLEVRNTYGNDFMSWLRDSGVNA